MRPIVTERKWAFTGSSKLLRGEPPMDSDPYTPKRFFMYYRHVYKTYQIYSMLAYLENLKN